ncbi:MAG: YbaB/EbfC family nucleoid-associated protein [Runella slithyformis]|jgi:nucleoid-associated protein EbfC|nr:MAG: YbaB/EbfC family nucleoid-associated protein [Runella slithyformis]TAF97426.1 MAG: YbaB/EbfC family nucleoid-associated protein [Runella sp.]TAG22207.1 MAG: YbaB/EbfC family nucleoid-associated protein [Cytophagales bacterium]TAG41296.1 MAG: YbaB/EbfC family nucleoid-associated protein [Cytophagia bacterium]TAE93684.1 MAG: YbaB/EbfC family nucleoid-associated protein [Runella slithyformis]
MFGGMGDMMGMLGKVKEFQAKMKEAQESLGDLSESGESGGGMVKATVNGQKKVISLEIDPDLLRPEDAEMVQDLVLAAVNNALEKIEDQIKEHMRQSTEGLLPNIPGLDLGKLMK